MGSNLSTDRILYRADKEFPPTTTTIKNLTGEDFSIKDIEFGPVKIPNEYKLPETSVSNLTVLKENSTTDKLQVLECIAELPEKVLDTILVISPLMIPSAIGRADVFILGPKDENGVYSYLIPLSRDAENA